MTGVLGMFETERDGHSVYLRGWGDPFHHSLVVTEGPAPRVAHVGWRAAGAEALERAAEGIEAHGGGEGWVDAVLGHGRAYRYRSPGGHLHEVFWDVDRYQAPPELASSFPNRPQKFVPVGAAVRQIDHVTIATSAMTSDVEFYRDVLGSRFMECAVMSADDSEPFFAQLSNNEQAHDLGLIADRAAGGGRSHHIAFWVDQAADVYRAADALSEAGVQVEWGPGRHGHGENTFLYVREPGGHRIEMFSGGYRNYQPDWEPARWVVGTGGADMYCNWPAPDAFLDIFPPATANMPGDTGNPFSVVSVS
jgi:catechol 2,3-dioxygenase